MTYISAFRCEGGVVMCADTQETVEDEKQYVEKLYVPENISYPIAIGGAGLEEPIEAFSQELLERVVNQKPPTIGELRAVIRESIAEVYASDAKISAWPKAYRTTQLIVAAKPPRDDYVIFKITGKRVYKIAPDSGVIIGYTTAANYALLKRLHRNDLPMQQAVMLAVYLVSQSKARDGWVGGDTRIAIVRDNGGWIDDPEYIKQSEIFIERFLKLTDPLFLDCVDVSIPPASVFPEKLKQFGEHVTELRSEVLLYSAGHSLNQAFRNPKFRGDAYSKVFPGAITTLMEDGTITVREATPEESEYRRSMMKEVWDAADKQEMQRFESMLRGRQVLYVGEEKAKVMGGRGTL